MDDFVNGDAPTAALLREPLHALGSDLEVPRRQAHVDAALDEGERQAERSFGRHHRRLFMNAHEDGDLFALQLVEGRLRRG